MIKHSTFALAGALLAMAVPATAATKAGAAADNGEASVAAKHGRATTEPRICVVDSVTGSRLPQRVCRTKAEWAAEGVDFDKN